MTFTARIQLLCLAALMAPTIVAAQSEAPDAYNSGVVIKSSTRIVHLPLIARDKHGKILMNLTTDSLQLTEGGQPQTIKYFDHDLNQPLTLGLLVDVSASVNNTLKEERDASKTFLSKMVGAEDSAFVVQFSRAVQLLTAPTGSHAILKDALGHLAPLAPPSDAASTHHGGTHLYDAIIYACSQIMPSQTHRKALILLTDGLDTTNSTTLEQAIEAAQRADVIVYAIYFPNRPNTLYSGKATYVPHAIEGNNEKNAVVDGSKSLGHRKQHPDGRLVLMEMAYQTGGDMFDVSPRATVSSIYQEIERELRSQYSVGYTPPEHSAPGFHPVSIVAHDPTLKLQTRTGYYSDK